MGEADTQHDALIGATLVGRYRIEAKIGSGAMGSVYRAIQRGLGRPVALKVLRPDLRWGEDTVARFRREAQAMSALTHPHTVRVFDFGATPDGLLYLAMEMLEGELVTERVRGRGGLPPAEAVRYAQQVLRSIGEAHAKRIIHRDIKPDNIFLARVQGRDDPVVKVLDFGIAKAIEGEHTINQFETQDGTVFGTPRYMSPEQAQGRPLDQRSDLYAVGIMLYEFLAGRPPFTDDDAVVVMAKHIREKAPPIAEVAPSALLPASLEQVLDRALAKHPEERFQSAEEFDRALGQCLRDSLALERVPAVGRPLAATALKLPNTSRRWAAVAAAAIACVVAALLLWPRGDDQEFAAKATPPETAPAAAPPSAPVIASVKLGTRPPGAQVRREGKLVGVTPLDLALPTEGRLSVRLSKRGYRSMTVELSRDVPDAVFELEPTRERRASAEGRAPEAAGRAPRPAKKPRAPRPAGSQTPADDAPTSADDSPYEKF